MKKIDGKIVALSGVSSALSIIFTLCAIYIPYVTIACYVIAALCIALPFIKRSVIGGIFAYISSSLISFFVAKINVLPFILFFGIYSIVEYLLDFRLFEIEKISKSIKYTINIAVKIVFYFAAFFAMFYLMKISLSDFVLFGIEWTLPLLLIAGFVFFVVYDFLYKKAYILMERTIIKRI